jgi:fructose-1,6-bisphosphatase I
MSFFNTNRFITLEHYISYEKDKHPGATGEFTYLLHDLALAIRIISREVRRAGLNDIIGMAGDVNVHGEQVKKLDVYANDVIIKSMDHGGHLCVMASEENELPIQIPDKFEKGKYVLVFDPLDGSSNIDINVTIGTIFGLYKKEDNTDVNNQNSLNSLLIQPGYKQVAAGYALYGSSTVFVYTTGQGVNMFTYDPTIGEFILFHENVKIPQKSAYYSINEGYYNLYSKEIQQYLRYIKQDDKTKAMPYKLRYIGTGVADFHRTLLYGGIFMYPADNKNPNGKLRLVYEANPLAMLAEQAGGRASDGKNRILNLQPKSIHQRVPLFVGSRDNVIEVEKFISGELTFE